MKHNGLKRACLEGQTKYYAYAFNQWVEISEEVYMFMKQDERKERYYYEKCRAHGVVSLDQIIENVGNHGDDMSFCEELVVPSAEDTVISQYENSLDERAVAFAVQAIEMLEGLERIIAFDVLMLGKSIREVSRDNCVNRYKAKEVLMLACANLREMYYAEFKNE